MAALSYYVRAGTVQTGQTADENRSAVNFPAVADLQDINEKDGPFDAIDDPVDPDPKRPTAPPLAGKRFPRIGLLLKRQERRPNSRMERPIVSKKPLVSLLRLTLKKNFIQARVPDRSLGAISLFFLS